jgi:hypothetical protein
MSEFYGRIQGGRGEATRCGSKVSGISATVESWTSVLATTMHDMDGEHRTYIDLHGKHGMSVLYVGFNADLAYTHAQDDRVKEALKAVEDAIKHLDQAAHAVEDDARADRENEKAAA